MLRLFAMCLLLASAASLADDAPPNQPKKLEPLPPPSIVDAQTTLGGQTINYRVTSGFLPLTGEDHQRHARVFHMAYERVDSATTKPSTMAATAPATQPNHRPITFIFNGGPGAGSLWLHIGTAGPMRVDLPDDGGIPAPPYKLKANPYSWLDFTDLVFIDPVGTGFSRAEDGHADEYYSVQGDLNSVADVIRLYLTQNDRWLSPKFVVGESYGTTRAAGLSELLHDRYGIDANGIVLISTVLDFQTLSPGSGNDTAFPLWLPTYTSVAHFHHRLAADLQSLPIDQAVARARQFATDRYAPALMRGTSLPAEQFDSIATEFAHFVGLPLDYCKRARLRVWPGRFEKELLADQQKMIGRMDGRITADAADAIDDVPDFDPSLTGYVGIFSGCFNDYVRRELHVESDLPYEFLTSTFEPKSRGGDGYLDVSGALRRAIAKIPTLKVEVESGLYDLATPFFATEYTINQLPLSSNLRKNISQKYYEGGHMIYLNVPSLAKLHENLQHFYNSANQ